MNPTLVACLLSSAATGATSAIAVGLAGMGWILAVLAYMTVSSAALVLGALAVRAGEPRPQPVPVEALAVRRIVA